jgi:GTP-binding protein HflX
VVWNKIDATAANAGVERDEYGKIARVRVSARTGEGLDLLRSALAEIACNGAEPDAEVPVE